MRSRALRALAVIIYRRPLWILGCAAVVTLGALLVVARLELNFALLGLLPQNSPVVQTYFDSVEQFGLADRMVLVLESDDPLDMEWTGEIVDRLAEEIRQTGLVQDLEHRLDGGLEESLSRALLRHLTLFLDEPGARRLMSRLTPEGMEQELARMRKLLLSGASPAVVDRLARDPLGLLEDLPVQSSLLGEADRFRIEDGYLLTPDRRRVLLMARPTAPAQDMDYARRLDEGIRGSWDRTLADLTDSESRRVAAGLRLRTAGVHAIARHESAVIHRDVLITTLSSLVGIILLFTLAFRRLSTALYVAIPLIVGTLWGLAAGALAFGSLNLITSVCSAIVIGLGVDFAVHIYSRYQDELRLRSHPEEALTVAMAETGSGILAGALTTAVAFYVMTLTEFRGIAEFGFITGTGILCCLVAMITVLPALLALRARMGRPLAGQARLRSFGLRELGSLVERYPFRILLGSLILTMACIISLPWVRFNDDFQALRSRSNPAMNLRDEMRTVLGADLRPTMLVIRGFDPSSLDDILARTSAALEPIRQAGLLASVDSLQRFFPSPEERRQTRSLLARELPPEWNHTFPERFRQAVEQAGLRWGPTMEDYAGLIQHALAERGQLRLEELQDGPLGTMLDRYHSRPGAEESALAFYLYPTPEASGPQRSQRFIQPLWEALADLPYSHQFTGINVLVAELKGLIHRSFRSVTLLVFVAVVAILVIHFRGVKPALLAAIPLAAGITWMLGGMVLLNMELNYMNIFVAAMVLGIGIDDGIHLIHRYRHCSGDVRQALISSGKAITMTSLTTMLAFGSLVLAEYQALASLGSLALLGVGCCWLASVILLPALLVVVGSIRERRDEEVVEEGYR